MQSHRSPRKPIQRSRQTPYAKQNSPRSGSIMSTIKSIVTAPLSWFAGNNEFEDTPGKRRRLPVTHSRDGIQQEPRVAKRQRVASPSPEPVQGYLDPPQFLFNSTPKSGLRPQETQTSAFSPVSTNIPSNFPEQRQQHHQDHLGRHTHPPTRPTSYPQLESLHKEYPGSQPQQHPITSDASKISLPLSRENSAVSLSRDHSAGPTHTPFRLRTTLSPYSSGNEYGPKSQRRERDPSEPPPLTALMSNPIFVKPPPDARPVQRSLSAQPTVPLGSLTHRAPRSPSRHASGLLFGLQGASSSTDPSLRPVNASEVALSELAVYRTPLLPTRLRGSNAIPDMFKPKKVHQIVPMRKDKDEMPRLGTMKKKKRIPKEESNKPYTGQGGMKKLLARRKLEAEAEKEKDVSDAMADDTVDSNPKVAEESETPNIHVIAAPIQEPAIQQHRVNGRETSSLRVGRTRISRQHIERPPPTRSMKKFSAVYDEDDSMDVAGDSGETQKPAPIFEAPKGFSFAAETPPAPTPTTVKEPPLSALPFSLTKAAPLPDTGDKPSSVTPSPAPLPSAFSSASVVPSIPAAPPPVISLTPPTPQLASKESDVPAPVPTIPNFFANSPLLNKSASAPPTPPTTGLFRPSPFPEKSGSAPPGTQSSFGSSAAPSAPEPSLFGGVKITTTSENSSSVSATPAPSETAAEANAPAQTSLLGHVPNQSVGTTSTPSASLFGVTQPKSLFGATPVQSLSSSNEGSLFGQFIGSTSGPSPATVPSPSNDVAKAPSIFPTRKNISFATFGTEVKSEVTTPEHPPATPAPTTAKPIFEPAHVSENKDVTKPPFSFGFSTTTPQSTPTKFDSNATSTTPAIEKPTPTLFGSVAAPAPSSGPGPSASSMFSFGTSNTVATNNGRTFFDTGSPRPATPKNDQEVRMEESPTRNMDTNDKNSGSGFFASRSMNFDQSTAGGSSLAPFTFGSSPGPNLFASKPEDKSESKPPASGFSFGSSGGVGFGGFGQKQAEPAQPPLSQSTPFSFGKPENSTPQNSSASPPFGFGTLKPIEINTSSGGQASAGFGFGQGSTSQGTSSFGFGQPSPVTVTAPQFTFGSSNQGTTASSFGQNTSAPSSPSTFGQSSSFGFGGSAGPSNAFSFQSAPPATTPSPGGAFSFGQPAASQSQSSASPFNAPLSPQLPGGSLFTIGAAPSNPSPGARQIKKLPNRRGAKR